MTDPIKDLLAVLDLPEEEQKMWLALNLILRCEQANETGTAIYPKAQLESLADLAFRLTPDEGYSWDRAKILVWKERDCEIAQIMKECRASHSVLLKAANEWVSSNKSMPIDRIIAALIAKELAKEKK